MPSIPRVRCDKCGKLVDKTEIMHHPLGGVEITVFCHGEYESMTVDWRFLEQEQSVVDALFSSEGLAFKQDKQIGNKEPI